MTLNDYKKKLIKKQWDLYENKHLYSKQLYSDELIKIERQYEDDVENHFKNIERRIKLEQLLKT